MGSNTKLFKACVEDRISALPDAIICRILSFLVTRDAVQTCLVSHRWNNVWTSVPNLEVSVSSKYDLDEHVCHAGFVDRVLLFRSLSNMYKFRLVCFGIEDYFDRIDAWVCTAIRRSVVQLELDLYTTPSSSHCFKLPTSLFICNTLVVLKLVLTDHVTSIPPNSSCFPSLKYLDVFVHYPVAVDSVAKLFSCSYPAFEHLNIHGNLGRLEDDEVLNLNICAPKLKRLRIRFCAVPEDDPYATDGGYE